jgi:hypothetical protein
MIKVSNENILQALEDTRKKIEGLKGFHVPVILKTIKDYEKAEVDEHFIEQQKVQLNKLYIMIYELEAKAERLWKRL